MRLGEGVAHFCAEINVDEVVRLYNHVVLDKEFSQLPVEQRTLVTLTVGYDQRSVSQWDRSKRLFIAKVFDVKSMSNTIQSRHFRTHLYRGGIRIKGVHFRVRQSQCEPDCVIPLRTAYIDDGGVALL